MTLHQLYVFIAAATTLNLRQAAQQLRIPQPAISRQLRALQEEFQLKLHKKIAKGIALTPEGELFLRKAQPIVTAAESLKAALAALARRTPSASLNIGGSYSPSAILLPLALARFKEKYPDIELNLTTGNRTAIERLVASGELDVAVLYNPPSNPALAMEPYKKAPLVAFVASSHPLARKKHLAMEHFRGVGFIIRKPVAGVRTGKQYLEELEKLGYTTKVVMCCDSLEAVKMAVRHKMGVGILYRDAVAQNGRHCEFKVLPLPADTLEGKHFIVYQTSRRLSGAALEFVKLLRTDRDKI